MSLEGDLPAEIRAFYFLRIPNVGDRVNAEILTSLSGRQVRWTGDNTLPHLMAAGSILGAATPSSVVWGTGVMHPNLGVGSAQSQNIRAVRGTLSSQALRAAGIAIGDIPLGDPGYLAPKVLGITRRPTEFRLGVVAHYTDRHRPEIRKILREPDVLDLNVHDAPRRFLDQMSRCDAVISSSLHGLVFAEALGIPNKWIVVGNDIAGDGFKFADWFSTTAAPERSPRQLKIDDRTDSLVQSTSLHESTIDPDALINALPTIASSEGIPSNVGTADSDRARPTPVFVISFNRAQELRKCIDGIGAQSRAVEIVIHDNGSTEERTVEYLAALERSGVKVIRAKAITTPEELNRVNETIAAYFENWVEPIRYVVTDCDIDISIAAPDLLETYDALLNRFRSVGCAGPMLRISDIPQDYPLFNRVMNRHIEQFWQHDPLIVEDRNGDVAVLECVIDTTFALHRAGEPFRRLKTAVRVYEPYEARHLDWYRTDDDEYTLRSSEEISHWNNAAEKARWAQEALLWDSYKIVRRAEDGRLRTTEIAVSSP